MALMTTKTRSVSAKQAELLFDAFNKYRALALAVQEAYTQLEIVKSLVADSLGVDPAKLVSVNEKGNTVEVEEVPAVDIPT